MRNDVCLLQGDSEPCLGRIFVPPWLRVERPKKVMMWQKVVVYLNYFVCDHLENIVHVMGGYIRATIQYCLS
jgi:hypothetical protein